MSENEHSKTGNQLITFIIMLVIYFGVTLLKESVFNHKTELDLRGMINNPEYEEEFSRFDSILKYELIKEEEFSDHWKFSRIGVRQSEMEPDADNNEAFESISKDYWASYNDNEFSLWHHITLHQPDVDLTGVYTDKKMSLQSRIAQNKLEAVPIYTLDEKGLYTICFYLLNEEGEISCTYCNLIHQTGSMMEDIVIYSQDNGIPELEAKALMDELIDLIL